MTKIMNIFKAVFLPLVLFLAMVSIFFDEWQKTIYFLIIYAVCLLGDRLKDIKNSLDFVWYVIYKGSKSDD